MAFPRCHFSLWMGYCYTINAHPRVDSFTEHLNYRTRAWMELAGCLILALPYVTLVAYLQPRLCRAFLLLGEHSDLRSA